MAWILKKKDGSLYHPDTLETLRRWVWEFRVDPDELVRPDENSNWMRAEDVPEIWSYFQPKIPLESEIQAKQTRRRRKRMGINLTPMIDVIFQLLIFFMLTASFRVESGVKVNLPKTEGQADELHKDVIVVITKGGNILIDNEAVDISHIKQRLSKIVKADNKKNLIIEADADVPHGLVVSVMDAGNVAGFEKLLVASEKANKSKNGK